VEYWIERLVLENNETMKIVVWEGEGEKMVVELEESDTWHWIVVRRSLRILLLSMALILGLLSVGLVRGLVMALLYGFKD